MEQTWKHQNPKHNYQVTLSKMTIEHTSKHQNIEFIIVKLSYPSNITQPMSCVHGPNNRVEDKDSRC